LHAEGVVRIVGLDDTADSKRIGGRIINNVRFVYDVSLAAKTAWDKKRKEKKERLPQMVLTKILEASRAAGLTLNLTLNTILLL